MGQVCGTYRHRDGHVRLGDGVHGAAHEGRLEYDVARDATLRRDNVGRKIDLPGKEREVVVGKAPVNCAVHKLLDGETIAGLVVCLKDFERGFRGQEAGGRAIAVHLSRRRRHYDSEQVQERFYKEIERRPSDEVGG